MEKELIPIPAVPAYILPFILPDEYINNYGHEQQML